MTIKIDYKKKIYPSDHIIKTTSELILKNVEILSIISRIYITLDKCNHEESTSDDFIKAVRRNCNMAVMAGAIEKELADEFCDIWVNITDEEIGTLLEEIISLHGPYDLSVIPFDFSREAKVYETKSQSNFDVIFFGSCHSIGKKNGQVISISGEIEFHECKKNICNFIPVDKNCDVKSNVKNKLNFMKEVNKICEDGKFYIPTLFYNVTAQQNYLIDNNYDFIKIIGIDELIKKYKNV